MSYLIGEWQQHLEAAGRSPNTVRTWVGVMRRLHADLPAGVAYASTRQLEAWLAHRDLGQWGLVTYTKAIRYFYRWADGYALAGDPAAGLARARVPADRPRPVTDDELHLALQRSTTFWRTAILLGALAGLRAFEMAALRRQDVTPQWIYIHRAKGGDPQTVPTHPQLLAVARAADSEWMLPAARRPGPATQLATRAGAYFRRRGLPGVTLHRFRHYYACSLLRAGVDLATISKLMRHASIRTTQAYLQVLDEQRAEGIRRLPSLN